MISVKRKRVEKFITESLLPPGNVDIGVKGFGTNILSKREENIM